jgi:flagellar hook-basal body complex protein FliE
MAEVVVDALNQMTSSQVGQVAGPAAGGADQAAGAGAAGGASFKDVLMQNLSEVNQLQQDADKSMENFVTGRTQNMGEVISATQKANMAFSMLTQIRNKLQDAYDEVKNLRI